MVDSLEIIDPEWTVNVLRPMEFLPQSNCGERDSGVIFNQLLDYQGAIDYQWPTLNDTITPGAFITVTQAGIYPFVVHDSRTGCVLYEDSVSVAFCPDDCRLRDFALLWWRSITRQMGQIGMSAGP